MDYNSTGGMRSPFSPRVRQSLSGRRALGLSTAKKNQSKYERTSQQQMGDVIYQTIHSTIETYGMPLPVMVTEALTFGSGDVSVGMSPSGWCWVVAGRRVLAWPQELTGSSGPVAARELILPQTDLAHKADLVFIFYENDVQTVPSCVGVSPEGIVRYWSSVGQEGAYSEVSCELAGQECDRLVSRVDDTGTTLGSLLLATTTCTLVKISTNREGRTTVSCTTLRPPSGWLGGIGRRVSLLFFGSMPAHADTKLVGVVILPNVPPTTDEEESDSDELICLVAGGPLLQMWSGSALHEHHLRRPLLDAAARAHLAPHGEPSTMEVTALDVQAAGDHTLLLLATISAVTPARPADTRYALAQIRVENPESPQVVSICAVGAGRQEEGSPRCLPLGLRALLYTSTALAIVPADTSVANEKPEHVDVSAEGDRVLGAGRGGNGALLVTRKHGLLRLTMALSTHHETQQSFTSSPMGSPSPSDIFDGNLTLYEIDPHEIGITTSDACGKLKAAFLFHLRRDANAGKILAELFPSRGATPSDVDAPLDRTVIAVASEMLDDVPAGDPRWRILTGSSRVSLGSSGALQASGQLRDKHRALTLYIDFLHAAGLWHRLGYVSKESGCGCVRSVRVLCTLAERLAAARALQRLHSAGATLVDAAMQQVSSDCDAEEEPEVCAALSAGALTAADVVLRRVTRVMRAVNVLARLPAPAVDANAAAAHAHHALRAITTILNEMHNVRSQWTSWCEGETDCEPCADLSLLVRYHTTAVTESAHNCQDASSRAQVLEASAVLADLLLMDAQTLPEHTYHRLRNDLIRPYIAEGEVDRAAALAEKFKAWELLVEMCIRKPDSERLYNYVDKYEHEGIAETAFAYLASGSGPDRAQLLRGLGERRPGRLARWLAAAPQRRELLAVHQLARAPLSDAAITLLQMAKDERDSVNRMVTMASLAKLCLVASDESKGQLRDKFQQSETVLSLGAQHRALPRDIRLHYGLGEHDMKISDPEELVQMYIDAESTSLTEYDYKKALDLTDFVEDPELREELRLKVWCASIIREDWSHVSVEDPQHAVQETLFYRLIDLLNIMGADVESLLPPLEMILEQKEVSRLTEDPRLHYLLKYTYACLTHHDTDQSME
ncbi:nuclear pore complex protein Nup133 [Pieris napi]|uniref:nuclear pore complex protein Nup133 n=1 Tax=Pieris napi TaxID=78633 RepID=UPI001FB87306|nr:nuclear pore complex protein Nup133 [Pieris napi]